MWVESQAADWMRALKPDAAGGNLHLTSRPAALASLNNPRAHANWQYPCRQPPGKEKKERDGTRHVIPGLKSTYKCLQEGSGAQKVQRGDKLLAQVTVNLFDKINGLYKKVLSTKDTDSPVLCTAGVGEVPQGWDAAWVGMQEGEERSVLIPPKEGWGEMGYDTWGIQANAIVNVVVKCIFINPTGEEQKENLFRYTSVFGGGVGGQSSYRLGLDDAPAAPLLIAGAGRGGVAAVAVEGPPLLAPPPEPLLITGPGGGRGGLVLRAGAPPPGAGAGRGAVPVRPMVKEPPPAPHGVAAGGPAPVIAGRSRGLQLKPGAPLALRGALAPAAAPPPAAADSVADPPAPPALAGPVAADDDSDDEELPFPDEEGDPFDAAGVGPPPAKRPCPPPADEAAAAAAAAVGLEAAMGRAAAELPPAAVDFAHVPRVD